MFVPAAAAAVGLATLIASNVTSKQKGFGTQEDVAHHVQRLMPLFPEMRLIRWHESHTDETYIREKLNAFLCTRNGDGVPYNDNVMTYVILHELAHGMQKQFGHGKEWMATFHDLLARATAAGIFNANLLLPNSEYCRYKLLN